MIGAGCGGGGGRGGGGCQNILRMKQTNHIHLMFHTDQAVSILLVMVSCFLLLSGSPCAYAASHECHQKLSEYRNYHQKLSGSMATGLDGAETKQLIRIPRRLG